jgi:hypothetical protein
VEPLKQPRSAYDLELMMSQLAQMPKRKDLGLGQIRLSPRTLRSSRLDKRVSTGRRSVKLTI